MLYFYSPREHKKPEFFWRFQEVWKCNTGLKFVKVIMNNFMNGYPIFSCSYPQAELYSIGYSTLNRTWPQEEDMLTTTITTPSSLDVCLVM